MDIGAVCAGQSPPPRFVPCLLSCNNCEALMNRPKNFRVYFLLAVLAIGGIVLLLREHRPSFLRPDLHLSAYVTTPDGSHIYTTASGNNTLLAIDTKSRAIVARAPTGREPVLAHVTPDGKSVLVVNRRDGSLGVHDATSLALRGSVSVITQPEDVVVLPDSSLAFVLSRSERRISVVDLRRGVLVTNLELAGKPTDMLLKPDGGELYVISPEAHGLQAINTATHEVGDYMVLGSAPTRGVLSEDASLMYVSDTAAGRVTPVDIFNRRIVRDPGKGFPIPAGDAPGALRFDPAENLLLVVSAGSGDLAVIRVRTNFLLTMIPVGDQPRELAVKLF